MGKKRVIPVAIVIVLLAATIGYIFLMSKEKKTANNKNNNSQTVSKTIDRHTIEMKPFSSIAEVGKDVILTWQIKGEEKTISHTAIYYDFTSHNGTFDANMTSGLSGYKKMTQDFAKGEFKIPRDFQSKLKFTSPGMVYWRVHAIIDGKNYWTDEKTISVGKIGMVK